MSKDELDNLNALSLEALVAKSGDYAEQLARSTERSRKNHTGLRRSTEELARSTENSRQNHTGLGRAVDNYKRFKTECATVD